MSAEAATATAASATLDASPNASPNTSATTQTSAAVEPFYKDWLGADGTLNHKALDRLPDHLKGLKPVWERAKTIEDVGTMFLNSQQLAGKKALAPLPADAPEPVKTERKQLMDTLNGVPATPKEYGITRPQDFPEAGWSQPAADNLAAWCHKHSVSPAAAKELMSEHGKIVQQQLQSQEQYETQFWQSQEKLFGDTIRAQNIPAERASALVEKGAIALGLDLNDEATKVFMKGANAKLMAMRHALATGESPTVQADGTAPAIPDPLAAAKDIQSNPANPLHGPYWNKEGKYSRAAQDAAVAKHVELLRLGAAKQDKK